MTTGTIIIQILSDAQLLGRFHAAREALWVARDEVGRCEQEIIRRAEERGAIGIIDPDGRFQCTVTRQNAYDQTAFTPLLELLTHEQLQKVYEPEHQETRTVPAKWDTVRLIAEARRIGKQALDIIEQARMPGAPRVEFREAKTRT